MPGSNDMLLTSEHILFSRYLSSSDWRPVRLRPRSDLRVLVLVANPANVQEYAPGGTTLAPVDVEGEVARIRESLGEGIATTVLASRGMATLDTLLSHLRDGYDILYLVAHGALIDDDPHLWLEDAAGNAAVTSGRELVRQMRDLRQRPRLVVLASCQSAGRGENGESSQDGGTLVALGPRLAEIGIPAVLAMQANISMQSVEQFMPVFFAELLKDGQIDYAMAVARSHVRGRDDWWMPVLFLRLRNGQLWKQTEDRERMEHTDSSRQRQQVSISGDYTLGTIAISDNSTIQGPTVGTNQGTITYNYIVQAPANQPPAIPSERQWFEPATVLIPAGPFLLGSNDGEDYEQPQHKVELAAYAIGITPVTNRQYAAFIHATGRLIPATALWNGQNPSDKQIDLPVTGIPFFDALAYCQWLSHQTKRFYCLPNEAQWEKAAHLADKVGFTWGTIGEWTCTLWGTSLLLPDHSCAYLWQNDNRNEVQVETKHFCRVVRGYIHTSLHTPRPSSRRGAPPDQPGPPGNRYGFRVILQEHPVLDNQRDGTL
jgi:formylglycine-generating enzyme required for sulfatase activity